MAQPSVLPGTKLLILVGDGAAPEQFAQPCGLTTKTFNMTAAMGSTVIPDCEDPDAPAFEAKDVTSLSAELSGEGVMAKESFDTWNNWFLSGESRNGRVELADDDLGHWAGKWKISSLQFGGVRGQKVTISVTLVNDGAIVWVPAA